MGHFGIFQIIINDHTVIDGDENFNFCFEESLLYAITNIKNNEGTEYQNMVLLFSHLAKDINYQDEQGNTALMLASKVGHHQVVQFLLIKVPDINIQNNNGWNALMAACCYGNHQVVNELLLTIDSDIDIQNNDGVTALMFASGNGHHQVAELLLSKDPDINIQNNNGWTALMFTMDITRLLNCY